MVQTLWITAGLLASPILGLLALQLIVGVLNDLADLLAWLFRIDTEK